MFILPVVIAGGAALLHYYDKSISKKWEDGLREEFENNFFSHQARFDINESKIYAEPEEILNLKV